MYVKLIHTGKFLMSLLLSSYIDCMLRCFVVGGIWCLSHVMINNIIIFFEMCVACVKLVHTDKFLMSLLFSSCIVCMLRCFVVGEIWCLSDVMINNTIIFLEMYVTCVKLVLTGKFLMSLLFSSCIVCMLSYFVVCGI